MIKLKSEADRLKTLKEKMQEYIENGAQLGWLVDPEKRTDIDSISGEGPVATFTLDLRGVWDTISAASR